MDKIYGVVVDTNKYAGNFEREMCAYITGHVGDCEVGEEYVREDSEGNPIVMEDVQSMPDDQGCYRPVSIYNNEQAENGRYNSLVIYFDKPVSDSTIREIKELAIEYAEYSGESIEILGVNRYTREVIHTLEKIG